MILIFQQKIFYASGFPPMGSDSVIIACWKISAISIHAFREGSDLAAAPPLLGHGAISIHAPRGGSDDTPVPFEK